MVSVRSVLDRITRRPERAPGPPPAYFSRFGGLWTDRSDADDEIRRRVASGRITADEATLLQHWREKGYVILPQAVAPEVCDAVRSDIERAWSEGDDRLSIFPPGSAAPAPLVAGAPTERMRVVDIYAYYESARQALFSDPIMRFLQTVFDDDPLLFQSLSFERGSQQGMHQDTAYVVVDSPLELAATWIALQDVEEGSGELMYYEGSNRLPEYCFSGAHKHWSPERDGEDQHTEWSQLIHSNAEEMGLTYRTFLPRKGDVLVWSADLAHGGTQARDPEKSRKSLVGHYCPRRCQPHYFSYLEDRRSVVPWRSGGYSSAHYQLPG